MEDPIADLIKKDFFVKENVIGESYSLNINNNSPTCNLFLFYYFIILAAFLAKTKLVELGSNNHLRLL